MASTTEGGLTLARELQKRVYFEALPLEIAYLRNNQFFPFSSLKQGFAIARRLRRDSSLLHAYLPDAEQARDKEINERSPQKRAARVDSESERLITSPLFA